MEIISEQEELVNGEPVGAPGDWIRNYPRTGFADFRQTAILLKFLHDRCLHITSGFLDTGSQHHIHTWVFTVGHCHPGKSQFLWRLIHNLVERDVFMSDLENEVEIMLL